MKTEINDEINYILNEFNNTKIVRVNKDDVWSLNKTTYGRKEVEKVFDNLHEALKYCQEHHYYESSEDE